MFSSSSVGRLVVGVLCSWLLPGCAVSHLTEIHSVDSPAFIESPHSAPVSVKQEFVVSVTTSYGGRIEPGPTRVTVSGLKAEIHPYNRTRVNLWKWWSDLVERGETRQIPLRFDAPGVATIQIIGRTSQRESQLIERHVEIK